MPVQGFFKGSQLAQVKAPASMTPKCGKCGFYKHCESPKQGTFGEGKLGILFVSTSPGAAEDLNNNPIAGKSSQFLVKHLQRLGVDLEEDCWLDNAVICYPNHSKVTTKEVDFCRPNIVQRIKQLKPTVIVPMGNEAIRSVIGWLWKGDPGGVGQWPGYAAPCQKLNAWICPTYNPAYVMREEDNRTPVLGIYFREQLAQAIELTKERPWDTVPDWESDVDIVMDTDKAARILRKFISRGGPIAFDYECNMLKPEGKQSEIICAGVSYNGKKTIAYPWSGAAIEASIDLLKASNPKIAANLKFEDRWTAKMLRARVRNWGFDTMMGAHALDSRPGTKSLKFQAFARLGMDSYNDHIERFFESAGTMSPNKIRQQIKMEDLLLYCGLDALLEFKLAQTQMNLLGLDEYL